MGLIGFHGTWTGPCWTMTIIPGRRRAPAPGRPKGRRGAPGLVQFQDQGRDDPASYRTGPGRAPGGGKRRAAYSPRRATTGPQGAKWYDAGGGWRGLALGMGIANVRGRVGPCSGRASGPGGFGDMSAAEGSPGSPASARKRPPWPSCANSTNRWSCPGRTNRPMVLPWPERPRGCWSLAADGFFPFTGRRRQGRGREDDKPVVRRQ